MEKKPEKYSMEDLEGVPEKEKIITVGLMIANELHNIYSMLWELKEKK